MSIADVRLLVHAQDEQPAWDIPLHSGQEYIGKDPEEGGGFTLVFDLGDHRSPSRAQVDYLEREHLRYMTAQGWAVLEPERVTVVPERARPLGEVVR